MDLGIKNRVALVTGGSGPGVGSHTCRALAADGARVAVTYRTNEAAARELVDEIERDGGQALAFAYDLADPAGMDRCVDTVADTWGTVDILVANAMSGPAPMSETPFGEVPRAAIQRRIRTDLEATLFTVQRVIPLMAAQNWGRIVLISSLGCERGWAGDAPFEIAAGASKSALLGVARSLGVEFGRRGVLTNVVTPGGIMTEQLEALLTPERLSILQARICSGRFSTPDEVARTVAFLASAANGNICGENVHVDGGS
ncbi:SDR family NAD(P)-dependent oxidoreductase [Streptomyces platensis]|uniref:SDR family NAD(P)-dependent oxidoreductase n=1 Tax=Streptomyces platensis TaxID=58346 RepID=UPI003865A43C|nr:SDR family oxidoreductase [Streptomyces platensis]